MSVKEETNLQQNVQRLIKERGGYVVKQHGSMITEPGRPDLLICYKGLFIAFECKVENEKPTRQQGINIRNIKKAGGITAVIRSLEEAERVLDYIRMSNIHIPRLLMEGIDDGTKY